jgi:hypothetical protein
MTEEQISICKSLGSVIYLPGSWDKRLGMTLFYAANNTTSLELTEKQNEWMYRLLYKYRRQIPATYEKFKDNPMCSQLKSKK